MIFFLWTPIFLIGVLYFPLLLSLYSKRWQYVDYTHAYFILPVSIFLIILKHKQIRQSIDFGKAKNWEGLLCLCGGAYLFFLGWRSDYVFISTFSLIPVLWGTIHFVYGGRTAKLMLFPILYLLLLVPPPLGILDSITVPMRYQSSVWTQHILNAFGFSVERQGLLLTMGSHQIFMGEACSGFRSLITLFSLASVYLYLINESKLTKTLLFLAIIPLAFIGNVVRVILLSLITFYFGEEVGQGFFHGFSGLIVFLIVIGGLLGLERLMTKKRTAVKTT